MHTQRFNRANFFNYVTTYDQFRGSILQGFSLLVGNDRWFLKIWRSKGWFSIRFHFFIKTSFKVDTEGWYCVTKGNISFSSLLLCFSQTCGCRLPLCELYILARRFSIKVCGWPLSSKCFLKFEIFSSNVVFEEFVRRILKASLSAGDRR